ncbi:hypothetical protein SAMN04487958_103202 [Vreelandella subterranea]|uniref:Uncharacterized protein n=1 Tax=Vreelandella subterranea TaxID=416874 RepID=A0A1H9SEJ0_9GAMM|nr:hypothetical protein SAMN04487958_103202 [Halomonas subterranea]
MTTAIATTFYDQSMTPRRQLVVSTTAPVAIGSWLRPCHVKAMCHLGFQAEQVAHHGFPFASVGFQAGAIGEVKHQPVGHFMRDNLVEKRASVFIQQHRIEP